MTVYDFLAWSESVPGRHELVEGQVVAMSPERVRHAEIKAAAFIALRDAAREAGILCRALPDGMTVRIDDWTAYEPDALLYCGPRLDPHSVVVPEPVIVVEVLSPGTRSRDMVGKLADYFKLASIQHSLILDPDRSLVVHHRRGEGDAIVTRVVAEGALALEPPGLSLSLSELFEEP